MTTIDDDLPTLIARHKAATEKHKQAKEECHRRLLETRLRPHYANDDSQYNEYESLSSRQPIPDPSQINQQVSRLKQRLDMLRSQSNDVAVRLTAKTMENDEREERLRENSEKVQLARERLDRMRQCLLMQSPADGSANIHGMAVVGGGLKDALVSGTKQIQTMRFHCACKVFDMHRLDVGEQYSKQPPNDNNDSSTKRSNESATGVGKIGGLPLPHAGPVLYGVIPPMILASSLRLVASLTQMVARCLGVVLPHPILVCSRECRCCGSMYDFGGDVIDMSDEDECHDNSEYGLCSACRKGSLENATTKRPQKANLQSSSSSAQSYRKSSLLSLVGVSARKAISITSSVTSRAITHMQQSSTSVDGTAPDHLPQKSSGLNTHLSAKSAAHSKASMSAESISRRINHASFAFLRENYDKSATEYVLNPPRYSDEGKKDSNTNNTSNMDNASGSKGQTDSNNWVQGQTFSNREEFHAAEERFATGMQLLQNDVVALCFRVGVDVSTLWPAESVLLNLHSLWCHCRKMAEVDCPQ